MANLLRYAKSASSWTKKDLLANNIALVKVDAAAFFKSVPFPQPRVSPLILKNLNKPPGDIPKDVRLFFQHLHLAKDPDTIESRVDDFGAHLLHLLHYDDHDCIICQKMEMKFKMAGETATAISNISILHKNLADVILVVENKVSIP